MLQGPLGSLSNWNGRRIPRAAALARRLPIAVVCSFGAKLNHVVRRIRRLEPRMFVVLTALGVRTIPVDGP